MTLFSCIGQIARTCFLIMCGNEKLHVQFPHGWKKWQYFKIWHSLKQKNNAIFKLESNTHKGEIIFLCETQHLTRCCWYLQVKLIDKDLQEFLYTLMGLNPWPTHWQRASKSFTYAPLGLKPWLFLKSQHPIIGYPNEPSWPLGSR
jgi:hypothetical protein